MITAIVIVSAKNVETLELSFKSNFPCKTGRYSYREPNSVYLLEWSRSLTMIELIYHINRIFIFNSLKFINETILESDCIIDFSN